MKNHLARRNGSIALHVVGMLLVLVVLGILSPWFIIAFLIRLGRCGHSCRGRTGGGEVSDALDSQFRDTDRRVRDTDRRVSDLDSRLDDLEGEHERLKSRFGYTEDLDHELRSLRDGLSGLETTTEEVDGRVDELDDRFEAAERTAKRLTQHVRPLEGQIMATRRLGRPGPPGTRRLPISSRPALEAVPALSSPPWVSMALIKRPLTLELTAQISTAAPPLPVATSMLPGSAPYIRLHLSLSQIHAPCRRQKMALPYLVM